MDWIIFCKDDNYCIVCIVGSSFNGEVFWMKVECGVKFGSIVYVSFGLEIELKVGFCIWIEIFGLDVNYGIFGEVDKVYLVNEMVFVGLLDCELIDKLLFGDCVVV